MPVVRLKIAFFMVVVVVSCVLVAMPYYGHFSLQSALNSASYSLSKLMYHVRKPLHKVDTSSSPDVIVRSVYFDSRPRHGHKNVSVFMVEMRKTILYDKLVVGCQIGRSYTTQLLVHTLNVNGWVGNYIDEKPFYSHTLAMVDCFDLPAQNGSRAALLYKTSENGIVIPAESERPVIVFVPLQQKTNDHGKSQYKVAACIGVVYGSPHYLKDWLNYQRTIGVDHVHMIAEDSFTSLQQSFIKKAQQDGFLSIDIWQQRLRSNVDIPYHSQMLAYHDCIYRFLGTDYEYMLFADYDDFFIPLVSQQKNLHYYIDNWCYKGSCIFEWIEFYPDCGMRSESRPDGNITSLLTSNVHKRLPFRKCLHRLSAIVEVGIHDTREKMSGYEAVAVGRDIAYVAHIRQLRGPPNGKC